MECVSLLEKLRELQFHFHLNLLLHQNTSSMILLQPPWCLYPESLLGSLQLLLVNNGLGDRQLLSPSLISESHTYYQILIKAKPIKQSSHLAQVFPLSTSKDPFLQLVEPCKQAYNVRVYGLSTQVLHMSFLKVNTSLHKATSSCWCSKLHSPF